MVDEHRRTPCKASGGIAILVATLAVIHLASPAAAQLVRLGGEFQVNSYTTDYQYQAALDADGDGDFVVVWASKGQDGSLRGVFARRFASTGAALGVELAVNTFTSMAQGSPAIAVDSAGAFVVVWQSSGQDGSGYGVFGRRFSIAGSALGGEFQINTFTPGNQLGPAIAQGGSGDFVVTWTSADQDGSGLGLFARRFTGAGAALASEFQVNVFTNSAQYTPSVAAEPDGDFVVAWSSYAQDGYMYTGIFARRFSSAGVALGVEFQVSVFSVFAQFAPAVAVDADGDFVVAWASYPQDDSLDGVFARRFSSAGTALGSEFQVNDHTVSRQTRPAVAVRADGDFLVTWDSDGGLDGSSYGIFARRFTSGGFALGPEFQINSYTSNAQTTVEVAIGGDGRFVVAWRSAHDGSLSGVFAQRLGASAPLDIDGDQSLGALTDGLLLLRYLFGFSGAVLTSGAVDLAGCARCDAAAIAAYIAGPPGPPGPAAPPIRVGPEIQVNAYTTGTQGSPTVSALAGGHFVVAWRSEDQDGSADGTFARVFSSDGSALSGDIQVNAYTSNTQRPGSVAVMPNGSFFVAWQSYQQDGSGFAAFERRFSMNGTAVGSEMQLDNYISGDQANPAIAASAEGDFVIAWQSHKDGGGDGIFARRFTSAGAPLTFDFQVNSHTAADQRLPSIAMASSGGFVVAWQSNAQDGSGYGVFARRFATGGSALGGDFQVNTYTSSSQFYPSVASDADGNLIVAWESYQQDGSGRGVFARTLTSTGAFASPEFQVTLVTAGNQFRPRAAALGDGTFIVTWHPGNSDGSGYGVFARAFTRTGSPLTGEFQVNTYTPGSQRFASIASAGGNNFVVAWQSDGEDGSDVGVFAQRMTKPNPFDLDGDGAVGALTDGLLALRYLFGFRGAALVSGAVGAGCTRCDAAAIEAYLVGLTA